MVDLVGPSCRSRRRNSAAVFNGHSGNCGAPHAMETTEHNPEQHRWFASHWLGGRLSRMAPTGKPPGSGNNFSAKALAYITSRPWRPAKPQYT